MWCLANKEFSSNVAMALVCSFTRVFSAREAWQTKTQSQSCTRFPWKPLARSCLFRYTLKVERIGLWATLMLKLRRTFVTLSENPLAQGRITKPRWSVSLISCCLLRWRPLRMIFVCLFFEVSTDQGYQFFFTMASNAAHKGTQNPTSHVLQQCQRAVEFKLLLKC